jgi:hypothetical protein
MLKLALLVSETAGAEILVILILAVAVAGAVTTQVWVPSLGVDPRIVVQVVPPFRDSSTLTLPVIPTDVQVIVWVLPTFQLSPPLGAVTVIDWTMLKLALLISKVAGVVTLDILTNAVAVTGPVTSQVCVPSLGVDPRIVVQVVPPFRESSILTLPVILADVQVIAWVLPTGQLSPPLGEVTVIDAGGGPVIVKSAALVPVAAGVTRLVILILAVAVAGAVTIQLYVPVLAVDATIVAQVDPLLRDTSIITLPVTPDDVHVIAW